MPTLDPPSYESGSIELERNEQTFKSQFGLHQECEYYSVITCAYMRACREIYYFDIVQSLVVVFIDLFYITYMYITMKLHAVYVAKLYHASHPLH